MLPRRPFAAPALSLVTIAALCVSQSVTASEPENKSNLGLSPSPEIQEAGKKISDEAQRFSKQAIAALNKGDAAAARRDFKKVLELAPDNTPTLINLGLL